MFRKILVPLDGSLFGVFAIDLALQISKQTGASLLLAHVHEPFVMSAGVPMVDTRLDLDNRELLDGTLERLHDRARMNSEQPCTLTFLEGDVAGTLREYVEEAEVDLVVMITRGKGGLRRAIFGSVASALVHALDVPIVFARSSTEQPEIEPRGVGPTAPINRILVPLDGSWVAEQVIEKLQGLLRPENTEYLFLRVITLLAPPTEGTFSNFATGSEDLGPRKVAAMKYLSEVADRLRAGGATAMTTVAVNDNPARAILGMARKHKAGMIAMATHGAGMFGRVVLGSVADKIIRASPVHVFVYRPPHENADKVGGADSIAPAPVPVVANYR